MNADFEIELGYPETQCYRRDPRVEAINRRLSENLLWLCQPADALIVNPPYTEALVLEARRRQVVLVSEDLVLGEEERVFTPWGWTANAIKLGERTGAIVKAVPLEIVKRVNSKLFSFKIEQELGVLMEGAATASSFEELQEVIRAGSQGSSDKKWVIKSHYGFAARDRVLGRGSVLDQASEVWVKKKFEKGETLIFQPWLEVLREYGVTMEIGESGSLQIVGISDLQTNGAGTGVGYLLARPIDNIRLGQLKEIAEEVGRRVFAEGYFGPIGFDALEHTRGLHPLLEINARYTMGFVALAVERELRPKEPLFWKIK